MEDFLKEINQNLDKRKNERKYGKKEDVDLRENCNTAKFGEVYRQGRDIEESRKKLSY